MIGTIIVVFACEEKRVAVLGEGQAHPIDMLRRELFAEGCGGGDGAVGQADFEHGDRAGRPVRDRVVCAAVRVWFGQGNGAEGEVGVFGVEEGGADRDCGQGGC